MADSGVLRIVMFRVGPGLWAAPAAMVREVIAAAKPTRIPGSGRTVAGLVNLRGTLLTVVDLRRAIGVTDPESDPESILVVEQSERVYGLMVDEVVDLLVIADSDITDGAAPAGIDPALVRGTGRHRGKPFVLLDTEAVLSPAVG